MKTFNQIIKLKPLFLENWVNEIDVYNDFQVFGFQTYHYNGSKNPDKTPKNIKILFAYYTYEEYSGDAFVLYYDKTTKKLYEVHGSHCSCFGLEGQWSPEECSLEGLQYRLEKGDCSYNGWSNPLKQFLNIQIT